VFNPDSQSQQEARMPRAKQKSAAKRKAGGKKRTARKATAAKRKKTTRRSTATRSTGARATDGPPKLPHGAELVVRQGFEIDATGRFPHAVPEVIVLGNRSGLQYLSEVFAFLAERAARRARSSEPLEEVRLERLEDPINVRLSDELEFRFAPLTDANRAATFKRYGITIKSRQRGSLFERYQQITQLQFGRVAQRLRYDAKRQEHRQL
jgi:hypothetical protein